MTRPYPHHLLIRDRHPFTATEWHYESPNNSQTLAHTIAQALQTHPGGVHADFAGAAVGTLALVTAFTALADGGSVHAGNLQHLRLSGLDGREALAWNALQGALAQGYSEEDHDVLDRIRMESQIPVERALRAGTHVGGLRIQVHPHQVHLRWSTGELTLSTADAAALGHALCGGSELHLPDLDALPGRLTLRGTAHHFTLEGGFHTVQTPASLQWTPTECFIIREVLLVAAGFSEGGAG